MEKDIVIEQLRTQLKQLRSRIAVMEEDQAADTAPLQGLLNQLGELKVRVRSDPHDALLVSPLWALHMSCFFSPDSRRFLLWISRCGKLAASLSNREVR